MSRSSSLVEVKQHMTHNSHYYTNAIRNFAEVQSDVQMLANGIKEYDLTTHVLLDRIQLEIAALQSQFIECCKCLQREGGLIELEVRAEPVDMKFETMIKPIEEEINEEVSNVEE